MEGHANYIEKLESTVREIPIREIHCLHYSAQPANQ